MPYPHILMRTWYMVQFNSRIDDALKQEYLDELLVLRCVFCKRRMYVVESGAVLGTCATNPLRSNISHRLQQTCPTLPVILSSWVKDAVALAWISRWWTFVSVVNCVRWWDSEKPSAMQEVVTQRLMLFVVLCERFRWSDGTRDTEIRGRETGKEPPFFWRRRKLEFARNWLFCL